MFEDLQHIADAETIYCTIHCLRRLTKKTLYTYIEIPLAGRSSNGRTADSESAYRGSNPCLPAKYFLKNQGQSSDWKELKLTRKIMSVLLASLDFCLFMPQTTFCQIEH